MFDAKEAFGEAEEDSGRCLLGKVVNCGSTCIAAVDTVDLHFPSTMYCLAGEQINLHN